MWIYYKGGLYCLLVSNSALQGVDLGWSKSTLHIVRIKSDLYVWTRSAMPSHVSLCSWLLIVLCWRSLELWNFKLNVTDRHFQVCEIFSHFKTDRDKHQCQYSFKGPVTWCFIWLFLCFSLHITSHCLISSMFLTTRSTTTSISLRL